MTEKDTIITGTDSPENASKVIKDIEESFPGVRCGIVSDPEDISDFTPVPVQSNTVLIQVTIPRGIEVNTVDLMRIWSDSLNKK